MGASLIVNIQGDEPVLVPTMIHALVEALQDESDLMASLMTRIKDPAAFNDRNRVKVVVDKEGFALYFSRAPIPTSLRKDSSNISGSMDTRKNFLPILRIARSRLEKSRASSSCGLLKTAIGSK